MSFKTFFNAYLRARGERFAGKVVVDFPAGSGDASGTLASLGARVLAFDLFPEFFKTEGLRCARANIVDGIPLPDKHADVVVCQEGIEHFSDQLKALREFNRILKVGGRLIVTTPNYSNLRARLSYLLAESERFGTMMPPNELDSVWMSAQDVSPELYLGHVFLIGVQKLRALARLSGFRIAAVNFEAAKPTSMLLFPFVYPFIVLANLWAYRNSLRRPSDYPRHTRQQVYREILRLNLSPKILVDGTLFLELEKEMDSGDVARSLKSRYTSFDQPT